MLFNTQPFAIFFVAVFCGAWLLRRSDRPRILFLLAASYVFYGWWSWKFLGLIVFSTALDYVVGRAMGSATRPGRRRALLLVSLVGNLGVLGFFKYWNFFATELVSGLADFGLTVSPLTLDLILPVGISFYTFQSLSYTIDIYRRQLEPEPDFSRFALFVAFFPQLVAGPIVRARHFLPQLRQTPVLRPSEFESGLWLIFVGLVKKVVIADYLGRTLVDPFWVDPGSYGGVISLIAVYGYAFQIYCDFSGYSDIAIGTGRLLGFDLGSNFRAPYRSTSPRELWTRWHISLSSWLRDYLYIPLGGNQGGMVATARNLMITMLLGGLWHGASWMFVAWGGFHGLLLAIGRILQPADDPALVARWARRLLMFNLICLAWVMFRSAHPADAWAVLGSLTAPRGSAAVPAHVWFVLILAFVTHMPTRSFKNGLRDAFTSLPGVVQGAAYAGVLGLLMNAESSKTPFIYFQF
jgi:D-alanyl-lipoteichoic acid acyltransferase DltB (MBOAT superfamily)